MGDIEFSEKDFHALLEVSKEEILKFVSEQEIFEHYVGRIKPGKAIASPLRQERHPSFNIYYNERNQLRYKDFGHSQGDCFKLVQYLYQCSFSEAIKFIDLDLGVGIYAGRQNFTYPVKGERKYTCDLSLPAKKENVLLIKYQEFTKVDKDYWWRYYISEKLLLFYRVFSANVVFLNDRIYDRYSPANPIYAYKFDERFKIYKPLENDKKRKWLSNARGYDIQGLNQLQEKGELLIITKSLKDVMVLRILGYPAIAPQSESNHIPSDFIALMKQRFKRVIFLYDNDGPGVELVEKHCKEHDLLYILIPLDSGCKDVSDFTYAYGIKEANGLINQLIF